MTAVGFIRPVSQPGELSAKSSISAWDLADHGVGDFAGRIRTSNGDLPTRQAS
jgi:hypothetical protein